MKISEAREEGCFVESYFYDTENKTENKTPAQHYAYCYPETNDTSFTGLDNERGGGRL